MSAAPAAKRARARALDAVVSTLAVPGLGFLRSLFVQADGTYLVSTGGDTLQLLTPSGWRTLIAGSNEEEAGFEDGEGAAARFNGPVGITVDAAGDAVVADYNNHALRRVSQAGAVSTLAGGGEDGEAGFADGEGAAARFLDPHSVVYLPDSGEFVVSCDHALRVVTSGGGVRTLAGSGQPGFADGQGAAARFHAPTGLVLDADGRSVLVADEGNHAVRRVTIAGAVSTVAGNGEAGFADGEGAAARFHYPRDVVVDKEGTIVVADCYNHRLRKITGGQVTTLAGGSEKGAADGAGAGARFNEPFALALDERGRLLVAENDRAGTLRVVEASLAPPAWMGPAGPAAAAAPDETKITLAALQVDYGKLVDDDDLADGVIVAGGESFPLHRNVLAARSEYFRGRFKSGMQDADSKEVCFEDVSAAAFRVLLRFLYTGELPVWGGEAGRGGAGAGGSGRGHGGAGAGAGAGGRGGKKGTGGNNGGQGGRGKKEDTAEEEAESEVQELLRVADRFQAGGLYEHCLAEFGRALTVETAIPQLVWAHAHAPEGARAVAMQYVVANCRTIQVCCTRTGRGVLGWRVQVVAWVAFAGAGLVR
jgi:DNA-binding beta-propeller fold protein YncE